MALQEEMERHGAWLFRWRGYLPLVVLALSMAALPKQVGSEDGKEWIRWWAIGCLIISFFGLGVRALTIGYVDSGTSGKNTRAQRAERLNTLGMYSIVRHPLYLGNFIIALGIILVTGSWWMILLYTLSFWLYYERIMLAEEAYLRNKFGPEFSEWANRTPTFLPRFREWKQPEVSFGTRTVLRREYGGFLAIILCIFFLQFVGGLMRGGKPVVDPLWIALLSSGFVIWLVLRILVKGTKLLSVGGPRC